MQPSRLGKILLQEFLEPMGMSQNRVGLDMRMPARGSNEIVLGKRLMTADTASRLAKDFYRSPQVWLGLQVDDDLEVAMDRISEKIDVEFHAPLSA